MTAAQRRRLRVSVLALGVIGVLVGLLAYVLPSVDPVPASLVVFTIGTAIAELLPFEKARGRSVPMSTAVLGAYALLHIPPTDLAIAAAFGWSFESSTRFIRGQNIRWSEGLARVTGAWALAGVVAIGATVSTVTFESDLQLMIVPTVMVWGTIILGLPLWEAVESTAKLQVPVRPVFLGLLSAGWQGTVALSASATLGALVHPVLGGWAIPMILLPLMAARVGLARYTEVRRTYDQTIRAMSRLPEELGAVPHGHGVRVGILTMQVAREMALAEHQVEAAVRAAHLHEVGRVRIEDRDASQRELALAGGSIVREAGSMDGVADLIEHHRDPYRLPQRGHDPSVRIGARIVRTTCEYDRALSDGRAEEPWDALEVLNLGMAYEHDPEVIGALTRILTRRGVI